MAAGIASKRNRKIFWTSFFLTHLKRSDSLPDLHTPVEQESDNTASVENVEAFTTQYSAPVHSFLDSRY